MNKLHWLKPNGVVIITNDALATVKKAEALGWELVEEEAPGAAVAAKIEVDARYIPWDARINAGNKSVDGNGNWKYKRGVSAEEIQKVESELALNAINGGD